MVEAQDAVERAARESYGRLLAYLAVQWRDVAAAEDALADAFVAALASWPRTGVPAKPDAWLLTAARRRLIDGARRARVQAQALPELAGRLQQAADAPGELAAALPDERLRMLLACAHPAVDPAMRTPLMLQTVLGLDAARIASAFVVKPATMAQRLTRTKAKLREAGVRFELPEREELPQRLDAVLEAVYAAYGSGWDEASGADSRRRELAGEALYLGRLLQRLLPAEPEVLGLLALMLHCEARRPARRTGSGAYMPLSEQPVGLWSAALIGEAEGCLARAAQAGRTGRFQLQAAIQSVHNDRARTGYTDWEAIALLYEGLVRTAPTVAALVGRAAAAGEARGAASGFALLAAVPAAAADGYQPYWALAAHLLTQLGRSEQAAAAYSRAIGLCADPAVRDFLLRQSARLERQERQE
ncbi:RNA polymerase subunit sigma-70 [Paenibacillus athensensis]|uniref:RNA polymerase subunit sigma-70 n=1 Tax=Paenibacillus athensensis TaxID=1967502 RepID=A0A4Y8Q8B1_9BACL|nr:DUF6596 domain-containing protein [Paenibacillus athensensis]MCD1259800.1 RNA polymerase subunit sigma-70 [Paenibacillus athensensis]